MGEAADVCCEAVTAAAGDSFGVPPPASTAAITAATTVAAPVITAAMIGVRWLRSVLPPSPSLVRCRQRQTPRILQQVTFGR